MKAITIGLSRAYPSFMAVTPSPWHLLPKYGKAIAAVLKAIKDVRRLQQGETIEEYIGKELSGIVLRPVTRRTGKIMYKSLMMAQIKSNRTLLDPVIREAEKDDNGRIIRRMVVIYHDANKAQKHLDVHIGRTSLIYRITGKPVESMIRFNPKGELTQESKDALMDHLRAEIANNSRVAQNLDHSRSNAKCIWMMGENGLSGYGSGPTRQIVAEGDVEFYHHRVRSSEHVYAPLISGSQGTYLYQIYPGNDDRETPILVWGKLKPREVKFKDKLHLKLIHPEELDKFQKKINWKTNTRKYDGASVFFHSNTGQGFKFFSPRDSKETGHRIEYTYKIPELAEVGHNAHPVGMGELMFWKYTFCGKLINEFVDWRGIEGICSNYMDAAAIGGILNSKQVRPRDVYPELRLYRIDEWNGVETYHLPFFDNRYFQILLSLDLNSKYWKVVERAAPKHDMRTRLWEGFVGVPDGEPLYNGFKVKWWGDDQDWEVIRNELSVSPKGNVQGVVWFKSLESGRMFKLGPGQLGTFERNMSFIEAGDKIVGMVAKVHGRRGHEGRAAKLVAWHLDKGIGEVAT